MTIDVFMKNIDEDFLDEIDEIMEDFMIDIFIVHINTKDELDNIKIVANRLNPIFYATSIELKDDTDKNCVGYIIKNTTSVQLIKEQDKAIFIDEKLLDEAMIKTLSETSNSGVILNATKEHNELENFYISFGEKNILKFDTKILEKISMDKIVLESGYREFNFDSISNTVKIISDSMLRPEQSIIARATKNSLALFNF